MSQSRSKRTKQRTTDEILRRKLALRRHLLKLDAPHELHKFITLVRPEYQCKWFHKVIADHCQMLYEGKIKNLMVFVPPQHGKLLDVETPVLTANRGWVKHGDLRPGDEVFSPDGSPKRVLATTPHYEWDCRRVSFAQGEPLIASFNHEWCCYIPNSDHEAIYYPDIETDEIWRKRRDRSPYLRCTKPLQYPQRDLPIPPYLLGLWLGDGCSNSARVCKSPDDVAFFLTQYKGKVVYEQPARTSLYCTFDEMSLTHLKELGLYKNKHIPEAYKTASIDQRIALLQGLMDTDGSCSKGGDCEIVQIRKDLAYDIFELIRSLGHKPRMTEGDARLYGRRTSDKYRIFFNPDKDAPIFRLPRKLSRLQNKTKADREDKYKHFITNIEPCGKVLGNCIQVEGGYYLAGRELRPTHNSEIISRCFPAWALGKNPDLKIVGTSYAADLATAFSRSIQRIVDMPEYREVFPETFLNGSNVRTMVRGYLRNVDIFETVGHTGFYKAVGVGGALTGTPADIAIIDDPVKNWEEANSISYRETTWEWYVTVLQTRLHNNSKRLFIMTRWHEDDLAGRILKKNPEEWTVLSFPAICEREGDGGFSKRKVGEALWEERHGLKKLLSAQRESPREFNALYQQRPIVEGGNIVHRDWFQHVSYDKFRSLRFDEPVHFYLDTAYARKQQKVDNDPSGILAACRIGKNVYILHAQEVWKDMPDLLRFIPEYMRSHHGDNRSILHVEPKANGISVIQMLKEISTLNVRRTPTPTDSKDVRLKAVSPRIECGRVFLVDGSWTEDFMDEVCGFPAQPHDEYVDILGYAINDLYREEERDWSNLINPFR